MGAATRAALLAWATVGLLLAGAEARERPESWQLYVNQRFGASVEYPDRFSVRLRPPDNGDGQRFRTADGTAELAVFGFYNVLEETTRQMMESRRRSGVAYSYADAKANSFVLSGRMGDRIVYERCLRSSEDRTVFACFDLGYPSADAAIYDPIATRISRSLKVEAPR